MNLQIIKKWVSPIRTHPWSEWNYRIPRNYEQQKWYSGRWQSVFHDISITRFRRQFEKVP